jgi:hypothetical protein
MKGKEKIKNYCNRIKPSKMKGKKNELAKEFMVWEQVKKLSVLIISRLA